MTENEALKTLEDLQRLLTNYRHISAELTEANGIAIQALEEIQAYRAIGTVEELQSMKEHGAFTGTELAQIAVCQMELQKYMAIGTIEDFKALKEQDHDCIIKHLSGECSYKETGCSDCKSKWKIKDLLEKSVAKKPHSISIANDIGNSMVECPICHARSDYDVKSIKRGYCWKCGQKLDWE